MKRKSKNICKFVEETGKADSLTANFVYETDPEVMKNMQIRKNNAIHLVVSGKGKLVTESGKYDIATGTLFFTFSGKHFKIDNTEELCYMYIVFSGERGDGLLERFDVTPNTCVFYGNEGLVSFWQNAIVHAGKKNLDLVSESVLLYSLASLTPDEKNEEQKLVHSIRSYVDSNFTDFALNLESVADYFGYNAKYVSRVFKAKTGMTFSKYLTSVRISHAVFLMGQGITSVKNVALLCGYSDPMYFSNVFKKETGAMASEYIKSKNAVQQE